MCGIAGVVGGSFSKEKFVMMLSKQAHRGPDATGIWEDEAVLLGHNRLSIIDLSSAANQPFKDNSERYTIVFNGEIYNYIVLKAQLDYSFKTASDTEVLLAAYIKWGADCLDYLNGMFAFAIWDKKEESLFIARDRFGVKPLYYHFDGEKLFFASEIKTLQEAGLGLIPNEKNWASYFCYGSYGMPNETFWEGIVQLPGGHTLTFKDKEVAVKRWYIFEEAIKKHQDKYTYEEAKTIYEELLKDSIHIRFRADVPVGFNISGGLDSSTLLTYVNLMNQSSNICAYTFYTNDERYDELPWVEEMISHTTNPLQKVLFTASDVPEMANYIAKIQDEPFGGIPTLAYADIFKQARKDGTLVLLDGQGMDEQWAGYDYYTKTTESTIQGVSKSPFRPEVLSDEMKQLAEKPVYPKLFKDQLLNLQYRDLFYTKIPRALRFNDRVSMAFSTELREPFLDYRLVEFAFAQSESFKIKNGVQKALVRELVTPYLSDSISYAPKRPLQTPQREWLSVELKEFVEEHLNKLKTSYYASWFDIESLEKEYVNYLNGDNDSSFHIWQWISLSLSLNLNKTTK